ncbi:putative undecaprenyl-phosphate N-acetylglucosaminyl 1-phosphate transferase [Treponema primitia ZAS-2]|uniref:Putative undecaprenyl-phosphate N-acetylglucosaminyl 1-phosphate transferase n=1 Tax=Treponema primitia (strain ATCC BAA-887 / DSM 12427 / ZAS-2) TaxID=545694 RepID=F5YPZ6_TREPZ|nr:MraY family glycosyltransferase [Treponema primitia]AEF86524.1 putative undecaprenyl-phosphate N-acetylglucosaminyl 1-phosphate transferase [Treponema primitia ZAS-2]
MALGIITTTFVLSCTFVAIVLRLSRKKAWFDPIDERKIHTGEVPRLGGLGFATAFILVVFGIIFLVPALGIKLPNALLGPSFIFPLISIIIIFISGVFDDFHPMAPRYKLFIQFIAGILVLIPNYTFNRIFPFNIGSLGELIWLRYPITFLWIVGLTNAVNFIDGVDGLAGGVSALAALFYALIFMHSPNGGPTSLLALCLVAALGGFLVFNLPFPRARIFMGDGGSQFLGFTLALLPLSNGTGTGIPVFYAAALLSIPIFDTIAAIWRRLRDGRRIDSPDRLHIHHKLMNMGLSSRKVDAVLYGLQILLGVLVFESLRFKGGLSILLLGAAYAATAGFFTFIHFANRAIQKQLKTHTSET